MSDNVTVQRMIANVEAITRPLYLEHLVQNKRFMPSEIDIFTEPPDCEDYEEWVVSVLTKPKTVVELMAASTKETSDE